MRSGNTRHPRQNTDSLTEGREKGEVQAVCGVMAILFLCVFLLAQLKISTLQAVSQETEDALALSALASATVDIEEYGISHKLWISDSGRAYNVFCESLKDHLNLNDSWEKADGTSICGKVTVERYILYNVSDDAVEICSVDQSGLQTAQTGILGSVFAPNGKRIETTSVYCEISYPVLLFPRIESTVHKGKLVDICSD